MENDYDPTRPIAGVELCTHNAFATTIVHALLPELAKDYTHRLLMPVRSIKLQQNGVTVYTGQGDRSSNVCVHLELHQVNITDSSQSCSFSG